MADPASKSGGWGDMINNPGFLSFMAGMGAEIDPQGVGGAIGRPTQQWIQSEQAGQAAGAQKKEQQEMFAMLLEFLGTGGKVQSKPDGSVTMEGNKRAGDGLRTQEEKRGLGEQTYEEGMAKLDPDNRKFGSAALALRKLWGG